jgi:hypothetical protein
MSGVRGRERCALDQALVVPLHTPTGNGTVNASYHNVHSYSMSRVPPDDINITDVAIGPRQGISLSLAFITTVLTHDCIGT